VTKKLISAGIDAAAIHGDKSQAQRERALAMFKTGKVRTLVATDIAARGIDVDAVSHVINYELPNVPEAYVHRIGRTARAGAEGVAITLCDAAERGLLKDIETLTRLTIPAEDRRLDRGRPLTTRPASSDEARKPRRRRRPGGGGGAGRPAQPKPQGAASQGRAKSWRPH
jgi:ATP-dependent RNA helicase RhlE